MRANAWRMQYTGPVFPVEHWSTDRQTAKDAQQGAGKGGEEDCKIADSDVKIAQCEIYQKNRLCKCFRRKKMHTTRLFFAYTNAKCKHKYI